MEWSGKQVVITGGLGFLGSHLTDTLAGLGASVVIVDNMSFGSAANLASTSKVQTLDYDLSSDEPLPRAARDRA